MYTVTSGSGFDDKLSRIHRKEMQVASALSEMKGPSNIWAKFAIFRLWMNNVD